MPEYGFSLCSSLYGKIPVREKSYTAGIFYAISCSRETSMVQLGHINSILGELFGGLFWGRGVKLHPTRQLLMEKCYRHKN